MSSGAVESQPTMEDMADQQNLDVQVNYQNALAVELDQKLNSLMDGNFIYNDQEYNLEGFDEEVEQEIEAIWNDCQSEIEDEAEKRRRELEDLYETEAHEKFERLAEMKTEYNMIIDRAENEGEKNALM